LSWEPIELKGGSLPDEMFDVFNHLGLGDVKIVYFGCICFDVKWFLKKNVFGQKYF
jgi:hypothetical protein